MNKLGLQLANWNRLENGRYEVKNVPLFTTHERYGEKYDLERITLIAKNSGESPRNARGPKVFIEHWGPRRGNLGRIDPTSIRVVGETIFGTLTNLRPALFQEMVNDALPQWSVEIDIQLDRIDGLAMLGADESYFPFYTLGFELDEAAQEALRADVEADRTYTYSKEGEVIIHDDGVELIGESTIPYSRLTEEHLARLRANQNKGSEMKLYSKNSKGESTEVAIPAGFQLVEKNGTYSIEPEDVETLNQMIDARIAPLQEAVAALGIKKDSEEAEDKSDQKLGNEEADEGERAADEEDKAKSMADEEAKDEHAADEDDKAEHGADADDEDDDNGKREEEDEKKEDSGKRSLKSDKRLAELEAELARLKYESSTTEVRKALTEAIDPKIYSDHARLVSEGVERVMGYKDESARKQAIGDFVHAYKRSGVPTDPIKTSEGSDTPTGEEAKARAYAEKVKADHKGKGTLYDRQTIEELTAFFVERPEQMVARTN